MNKKWKIKDVVIGKTFTVISLTLILAYLSNYFLNLGLRMTAFHKGAVSYIQIRMPISIVFVVPAFFIVVFAMKFVLNLRGVTNEVKQSHQIIMESEKKFKWHVAYSIAIGYLLLCIFYIVSKIIMFKAKNNFDMENTQSLLKYMVILLLCCVVPIVLAVKLTKFINKKLIKLTGTNEELIGALYRGELRQEIPEKLRTQEAIGGIINILSAPAATTLEGAIVEYRILCVIKKVAKASGIVALVIGAVIGIITMGIMNTAMLEVTEGIRGIGEELCHSIDQSREAAAAYAEEKKVKDSLWQNKRKAEKQRDFDVRRAADQIRYNPNTYEANRRVNIAKESQKAAEKAAKDYYKYKL